jgi:murein DD-endopeptidase / murein LD-carboxypeptidase
MTSFIGCKSSKQQKKKSSTSKVVIKPSIDSNNSIEYNEKTSTNKTESNKKYQPKAESIVDYAKEFEGVKYKWSGTTKAGMDCSGLVFESFRAFDVLLPRISRDMAKLGDEISLKKVSKGDLLFFKTRNRRNEINHVGLVVSVEDNETKFIHATTSAGVIISSLSEKYWNNAFIEARRIL